VSLERQSFFAPAGTERERLRDEIARLEAVLPTLRWLYGTSPSIARFFAALGHTRLYAQYPGSGNLPPDYDPTRRDWYRTGFAAAHIEITPPYRDATTGQLVVSAVTPLRSRGRRIGVAGVDVDLELLLASRRPDEEWRERVLVSVVRQGGDAARVVAEAGRVPGVDQEIAPETGREVDVSPRDPAGRSALERALRSDPPAVIRTEDERGDWLWAFARLPVAGPGSRFLAMAAPTAEVTAAADRIGESIREETRDELRRAAVHAGIGLAVVLALIALWAFRAPRSTSSAERRRRE
jgi:hypothetical protein